MAISELNRNGGGWPAAAGGKSVWQLTKIKLNTRNILELWNCFVPGQQKFGFPHFSKLYDIFIDPLYARVSKNDVLKAIS